MTGHHVFNTPKKHLYFKEEGIEQFYNFFTEVMKIKKSELILHEDIWAGGGNFGPSIEFFAYGLELGNQVYMQFEQLPNGDYRELKTKVIDMGSGAERWAWIGSGETMSYDTDNEYSSEPTINDEDSQVKMLGFTVNLDDIIKHREILRFNTNKTAELLLKYMCINV